MADTSFRERLLAYRGQDSDIGRLADDLSQGIENGDIPLSCQSFREIFEQVRRVHGKWLGDDCLILLAENLPLDSHFSDEEFSDMLGHLLSSAENVPKIDVTPLTESEYKKRIRVGLETPINERFGFGEPQVKAEDNGSHHAPGEEPEGPNTSTGPNVAPADLLERIKADPRALKDPATLAALAALKATDLIEYDLRVSAIKKAGTGIKVATINECVDKLHPGE
jgi:hypothetical protein